MFHEEVPDADGADPDAFRAAYAEAIASGLSGTDPDDVTAATGLDRATVDAFRAGELDGRTLDEAAAVVGHVEGYPRETVVGAVRDDLLIGMSNAILDVDTVAVEIDHDRTGQEIQQAIEGRTPFPLDLLAAVHHLIEARS